MDVTDNKYVWTKYGTSQTISYNSQLKSWVLLPMNGNSNNKLYYFMDLNDGTWYPDYGIKKWNSLNNNWQVFLNIQCLSTLYPVTRPTNAPTTVPSNSPSFAPLESPTSNPTNTPSQS